MLSAVLRLHCVDVPGIVFHISRFIFEHGGNIIDAQQHREELDNRFFMWVHFDCANIQCDRASLRQDLHQLAARFGMTVELGFSDERKRMAVLVSQYDHCLYDLFLRHQYGEIDAEFSLVISNHSTLKKVAEQFNTPFVHIPVTPQTKPEAEQEVLDVLQRHKIDFVVLARYMQILSPLLVDAYENRIINVHHGFLPAFKGAKPYHQAYEHGVKLIGATSHYVTAELDMGPIIEQETVRVRHSHSVHGLAALGRDVEKQVLASAVRAHASDRIMVYRRRTIVFRD